MRRLEDDVDHAIATCDPDPAHLPALPAPLLPAGLPIGAQPSGSDGSDAPGNDLLPGPDGRTLWRVNVPADVARLFRACLATVQLAGAVRVAGST